MPTPELITQDGRRAVFRTPEGDVEVDLESSPFARSLIEQQAAPTPPASQVQLEPLTITGSPEAWQAAPGGVETRGPGSVVATTPVFPESAQAAPTTLADVQSMTPAQRAAMRGQPMAGAVPFFTGEPVPQPPAAAPPGAPIGPTPERPFMYTGPADYSRPMPTTPGAAQPQQGSSGAYDLTGATPSRMGRGASPGRGAPGGGSGAPRREPSLDELMVGPNGLQPMGIDDLAGGSRGLNEARRLGQWQTDIAADRARIGQEGAEQARQAVEEGERRRVELEQDRRAAEFASRDRYRRALERVQAMQVDPSRFFRDGGNVIGAAIAVGLGAVGNAIAGNTGPNAAMELIQQTIDRDIEAQRSNIANAQAGLDGERTLVAEVAREFESREAAEQAARAAMLQQVEARVGEMLAGVASDEVQQQGQAMMVQLREQSQAAQAAALRAEEDRQMERALQMAQLRRRMAQAQREERRAMGGGQPAYRTPTSEVMDAANRLVLSGSDPMQVAQALRIDPALIPRDGVFASGTGTDQAATVSTLSSALDSIEQLVPRGDADIPGVGTLAGNLPDFLVSEDGRALRQALTNAEDLLGRLRSGGAIGAEEEVRFRRILGSSGSDEALRRGIETIRREIAARTRRAPQGASVDQRTRASVGAAGGSIRED
jgi:hypothetical protein